MMKVAPVTLEGSVVRLELARDEHIPGILAAGQNEAIWEFLPFGPYRTGDEWRELLHAWLQQMEQGKSIPFVIVRKNDGRVLGMTSYMSIAPTDHGLEIGGTWLTPEVWRSAINTECKYLLLRHAFEELGCIRVQLKTDARNIRSQQAIERLGAVKEGVLRKQMITRGGYQRDSVMYSIIDSEWPQVKARLEEYMKRDR
jgi:RimJ/RimL family protein N-acetyltransferase